MWILETKNLMSNYQCGFRPKQTLLQLARLENYIQNAFVNKGHVIAIFLNLEKAHGNTLSILKHLEEWGIKGHFALFIKKFLT